MTVVALASAKASPGVTTLGLALAATWPHARAVTLLEADPDGGDLTAWLGLDGQPSLVALAAEGRRGLDAGALARHAQRWPGTPASLLISPPGAEQAAAALTTLSQTGVRDTLAGIADGDVLIDCGRLRPGAVSIGLLRETAPVVLVARPTLAEVAHLRARIAAIPQTRPIGIVLIGERPYTPEEVAAATGVTVLGTVAADRAAAAAIATGRAGKTFARSRLGRSATVVAERLAAWAAGIAPVSQPIETPVHAPAVAEGVAAR